MRNHLSIVTGLGVLAVLTMANPCAAQSQASAGTQAQSQASAEAGKASMNASSMATTQASATIDKQKLEERAAKVSTEARSQTDAKLSAQAKKVDASAAGSGSANVTSRLSKEFGVSAEALSAEQAKFDAGWGQIMIAHTLSASASRVTADQLLTLRQDGMGWGDIAAGLGLSLGKTVSAVNAESQVALGQARADGQVTRIAGAGAEAQVNAATQAHLPVADAHTSVQAGLGLGLGHR